MLWSVCSENPVFVSTFLPFCPVLFWSQLVYGCGRVETRFYLSGTGVATLQSRPRLVTNPRRSAPVAMATECIWLSVTPPITQPTRGPRRPHSRNTFLPSRRKWDRNDQVETAFYLQKHHGTLRRAGGGRKVERQKNLKTSRTLWIWMKLENKVSKCQKRCAPRQHLFDSLTVLSIVSI